MLRACHHDWVPSGLHVYINIVILGCPCDAHWIPRWFPFGYTLGTLDFHLGVHCYAHGAPMPLPYGSPLVFDWVPHGIPMGGTHCMPLKSPLGPQWDPLGFPCGPHRRFPWDAHVVSVCFLVGFPFQGFLQGACF